jgi:hypothetical protein
MPYLDHEQKLRLFEDGYVRVPNAVPADLVRRALRAINHSLSKGLDSAQLTKLQAQGFCSELDSAPVILDLFERSGAREIVESATGPLQPAKGALIALRWPEPLDGPISTRPLWPHIDGTFSPTNGIPEGSPLLNYTANIGILLSDLPDTNAGNFTVWPGSHRVLNRQFHERGVEALLDNSKFPSIPGFGQPRQITGTAGDLVIAHYLLGHDYAINLSPHIRYKIFFFTVSTAQTDGNRLGGVADMWRDWAGMQGICASQRG